MGEVLRICIDGKTVIYVDSKHVPELAKAEADRDAALLRIQELEHVVSGFSSGAASSVCARIDAMLDVAPSLSWAATANSVECLKKERDDLRAKFEQLAQESERDLANALDCCDRANARAAAAEKRTEELEKQIAITQPAYESLDANYKTMRDAVCAAFGCNGGDSHKFTREAVEKKIAHRIKEATEGAEKRAEEAELELDLYRREHEGDREALRLAREKREAAEKRAEEPLNVLSKIRTWSLTFGGALMPGGHPDTYGEGMRSAKYQVSKLLDLLRGDPSANPVHPQIQAEQELSRDSAIFRPANEGENQPTLEERVAALEAWRQTGQ